MLRRQFLSCCACLLTGCGNVNSAPSKSKQKICSHPDALSIYNTYDKWGKTELTYHMLDRDTRHMKAEEWDAVWVESFRCWSEACPLTFKLIGTGSVGWQKADIIIDVNRTAEGFGSKGSILAWAEMPNSSDWDAPLWTQLDRSEDWVTERDDSDDTILQGVAVHEIGHLLGLGHSQYLSSVMYPYHVSDLIIAPQEYDIRAIQTLYGEK